MPSTMRANLAFLRLMGSAGVSDEPTSRPVAVSKPSEAPGEAASPFGNGLVRLATNVRPLLLVGTNGVDPANPCCKPKLWISTWCGAMKIPKPPRRTVLGFTVKAKPNRGCQFEVSVPQAARLLLSENEYPPITWNWSGVSK